MQHLCFRGAWLHPNISKTVKQGEEEDTGSPKKYSDLNKYKMETLDKQNEYGALEEKRIYRKTITETNTNHVEECRVA